MNTNNVWVGLHVWFLFEQPTYPETYAVADEKAPDGQHIVNIKDAVDTINACARDSREAQQTVEQFLLNKTDEELIVLGVCIRALWEQPWIKAIYSRKRGLFTVSDNMDYFFDKVLECMAPQYKPSDEVK